MIPGLERFSEKETATHSTIALAWEISIEQRSLKASVHGVGKNWTRLGDQAAAAAGLLSTFSEPGEVGERIPPQVMPLAY